MSRIAAYIGPPVSLAQLIYERSHALERQAYAPREMTDGAVSVDGSGLAWWREDDSEPLRYVTASPPRSDANLPHLASRFEGRTIVATVRSAPAGISTGAGTVPPFALDGIAGTHDGVLCRFREVTAARCLAKLPENLVGESEGLSDSLAVFLLAVAARREDPDLALSGALVGAVGTAMRICADAGAGCSLNVLLATADEVVAVRTAREVEANSLYVRNGIEGGAGAWLASEPLDDEPGWEPVPVDHVVRMTRTGLSIKPTRIHP